MTSPVILAHGALGYWDELIFLGIAVVFLLIMAASWMRSRSIEPETPEAEERGGPAAAPRQDKITRSDRFELD